MTSHYIYAYLNTEFPQDTNIAGVNVRFPPLFVGIAQYSQDRHAAINLDAIMPILYNIRLSRRLIRDINEGRDPSPIVIRDNLTASEADVILFNIIEQFGRVGREEGGILFNSRKPRISTGPSKQVEENESDEPPTSNLSKKGNPKRPGSMKEHNEMNLAKKIAFDTIPKGKNHWHAKTFIFISPAGEKFEITGGLEKFSKEHNLSVPMIYWHANKGKIEFDPERYKRRKKFSEQFYNTLGWTIIRPDKVKPPDIPE